MNSILVAGETLAVVPNAEYCECLERYLFQTKGFEIEIESGTDSWPSSSLPWVICFQIHHQKKWVGFDSFSKILILSFSFSGTVFGTICFVVYRNVCNCYYAIPLMVLVWDYYHGHKYEFRIQNDFAMNPAFGVDPLHDQRHSDYLYWYVVVYSTVQNSTWCSHQLANLHWNRNSHHHS